MSRNLSLTTHPVYQVSDYDASHSALAGYISYHILVMSISQPVQNLFLCLGGVTCKNMGVYVDSVESRCYGEFWMRATTILIGDELFAETSLRREVRPFF